MFTANVCPVTQSLKFGRVMPPLQQKSRVLHVVTDNKQRTTLKARRNLWHFQTQTKNRDIQSLGKLKGSAEAAGRHRLNAVNMMDRSTVRWGAGMIGVQIYPILRGQLKSKAVPLQAWSGAGGSRNLRFPDFMTTAQDSGKVVGLTHRPPLPPGNIPGTHLC